jgi:hypothetical protein
MVVTYVMVAVFVVGVIGAVASVLSYDKPYGELGSPMRIPRASRRRPPASRPSRQLQALEAALTKDAATDEPSCVPVRSHRWRRSFRKPRP